MKAMKYISGFISSVLLLLLLTGWASAQVVPGQDTLRTFGPRIGMDLSRFLYILADPSQKGAEISVDFEIYKNIYPVVELGYNSTSDSQELFDYSSSGSYGRAGIDYNFLHLPDRSIHHAITLGFRYGQSVFTHKVENVFIPGDYWGDYLPGPYENNLTGHWFELVGGLKTEVFSNFFLGMSFRYKILLNPGMDPLMIPELIPGYGTGGEDRTFGFTYSVFYMIPLIKK
jgi:hypothetical protein